MGNHNQINIITDHQGYLKNFYEWDEKIAIEIAKSEGIQLSTIHWEIIYFVRMFYAEYKITPKIRTIINIINLKYGSSKIGSKYLIQLFPKKSAIQQIAKISGLPKPKHCL